MNLELIANAIRTERELALRRSNLAGLFFDRANGAKLIAAFRGRVRTADRRPAAAA